MWKFFWFDTETTGTNAEKNGIIQIAGIIVIGGKEVESFDLRCNIHKNDIIEQEALDINGITPKQIESYPDPKGIYSIVKGMLDEHCNKFDKTDKFYPAGQNVKFDIEFLHHFFKKNGVAHPKQNCKGDPFLFSYLYGTNFDTLNLAMMYEMKIKKKVFKPNYKLATICKILGVELDNAHDALADIRATRKAANIMWAKITGAS